MPNASAAAAGCGSAVDSPLYEENIWKNSVSLYIYNIQEVRTTQFITLKTPNTCQASQLPVARGQKPLVLALRVTKKKERVHGEGVHTFSFLLAKRTCKPLKVTGPSDGAGMQKPLRSSLSSRSFRASSLSCRACSLSLSSAAVTHVGSAGFWGGADSADFLRSRTCAFCSSATASANSLLCRMDSTDGLK